MLFYIAALILGLIGIYRFRAAMLIIQRRNDAKAASRSITASCEIISEEQKDFKGFKRVG